MKLIGLIGRARSGKDTVGRHLSNSHDFLDQSFAAPMKNMLSVAFPGVNFRDGDREQPIPWLGKSPRQLLQTLGTEWGRDLIHSDLWTLMMQQKIQQARTDGWEGFVVTDVRFHNEAKMILAEGGELWHIIRDDAERVNGHISEEFTWEGFPLKSIDNNGSLIHLYRQVDHLARGDAFVAFKEQVRTFSDEEHPSLCHCDHKLQGTGAVFYQGIGILQCTQCNGWQSIRKPIK